MLVRVGDNGFPILHPSTCLYNLPLKLNTVPLVVLSDNNTIWGSLCCLYIWINKMWFMVSSKGVSAKSTVFLIVCWFFR